MVVVSDVRDDRIKANAPVGHQNSIVRRIGEVANPLRYHNLVPSIPFRQLAEIKGICEDE